MLNALSDCLFDFKCSYALLIQYVSYLQVENFLDDLPITSLPGIGHALGCKLETRKIHTCGQLRQVSKVLRKFTKLNIFSFFLGIFVLWWLLWNWCLNSIFSFFFSYVAFSLEKQVVWSIFLMLDTITLKWFLVSNFNAIVI